MKAYQKYMNDGREREFVEKCVCLVRKHRRNEFRIAHYGSAYYCGLRHVYEKDYVEFLPWQDWLDFCLEHDFYVVFETEDVDEQDVMFYTTRFEKKYGKI